MAKQKRCGLSYAKRVADINAIYDKYARIGLSNRAIWRKHIYPVYAISERTLYNILKASAREDTRVPDQQLELFSDASRSL